MASIYEQAASEAARRFLRAAEEKAIEKYPVYGTLPTFHRPPTHHRKRKIVRGKGKHSHGNPPFGSPAWRAKYGL